MIDPRSVQHIASQLGLQLAAIVASLALGRWQWACSVVLILYLLWLRRAGELLSDELPGDAARAFVLCVAGQLPGLALAGYVGLGFLGMMRDPLESVVVLQLWTTMWAPVLVWVPKATLATRSLYLWVTLALPLLQLTWVTDPLRMRSK